MQRKDLDINSETYGKFILWLWNGSLGAQMKEVSKTSVCI